MVPGLRLTPGMVCSHSLPGVPGPSPGRQPVAPPAPSPSARAPPGQVHDRPPELARRRFSPRGAAPLATGPGEASRELGFGRLGQGCLAVAQAMRMPQPEGAGGPQSTRRPSEQVGTAPRAHKCCLLGKGGEADPRKFNTEIGNFGLLVISAYLTLRFTMVIMKRIVFK